MEPAAVQVTIATAAASGAVAILQLHGPAAAGVLRRLTGAEDFPPARLRLVRFGDFDEGLAVAYREDWVQLMPHGGPRVVQRLLDRLDELGATYEPQPPARDLYPETQNELEADMLATLARAASPAAIDLLLEQPRLWRQLLPPLPPGEGRGEGSYKRAEFPDKPAPYHPPAPSPGSKTRHPLPEGEGFSAILARSEILDRLITPPSVVVVGRPNVGKSTLTNRLLGRAASIVADLPGTTRDWVAGLTELQGVAVRWLDTPGLRASADPIEQQAIALAGQVIASADVLIALRDAVTDWPELERRPTIRVINKCDVMPPPAADEALPISAATGLGLDELQRRVLAALGLSAEMLEPAPWAFSSRLREIVKSSDRSALARYVGRPTPSPSGRGLG